MGESADVWVLPFILFPKEVFMKLSNTEIKCIFKRMQMYAVESAKEYDNESH